MIAQYLSNISLRFKYAALSGIVMLVLSFGLSWTFISQTNQWLIDNLEVKGLSQVDDLARKIAPALNARDQEKVRQFVKASFREAEVAYLGVMDARGRIFDEKLRRQRFQETPRAVFENARMLKSPAAEVMADRAGRTTYFFVAPILDFDRPGQEALGTVALGISSHFVQRDIQEIIGITLPLYAVAILLSCILMFFLLARGLRPITDVARLTAKIAQGDFSQRIELNQKDEIGILARSFNLMAEALTEREIKRKEAEDAVAQKAEELARSNSRLYHSAEELKLAKEKLEKVNSTLTVQAAELARSNAELEQFAYIASHDLQEPLRMVASYVQLLARRFKGKLDSDADEFINFAVDGSKRMQNLINALLAYSRIGTKGREFEPTPCEAVLESTIKNLELVIEENHARITHDSMPTVPGDPTQLGQLFQNLIGNALKFRSDAPPEIHISAQRGDNEWLFSVRDNGIGIEPQYAERIFVIFQRLHNKDKYPGTGIGLALCKKIVERHGGRIWVDSEQRKGATFRFTIPA